MSDHMGWREGRCAVQGRAEGASEPWWDGVIGGGRLGAGPTCCEVLGSPLTSLCLALPSVMVK